MQNEKNHIQSIPIVGSLQRAAGENHLGAANGKDQALVVLCRCRDPGFIFRMEVSKRESPAPRGGGDPLPAAAGGDGASCLPDPGGEGERRTGISPGCSCPRGGGRVSSAASGMTNYYE